MGDWRQARVDLAGYMARMQEGQDAIYYITAENHQAASHSPHLEVFRKKGIEVLLMSDRVDEWMMAYFTEFDGNPFKSVAKGDIDLAAVKSPPKRIRIRKAMKQEDRTEALDADVLEESAEITGRACQRSAQQSAPDRFRLLPGAG